MAIPNNAVNYGNGNVNRNIFGFLTDQALSSPIEYRAWDNDNAFPAVDTVETIANIVLAGKTGNGNKSMVSLIDTTNAAPAVNNWKPWTATGGEANPNRLQGNVSYVQQDGSNLGASGRATFNMVIEIPFDALTTDPMGFDINITYTFTGSTPAPLFQYNDDLAGNEGSPIWISFTVGTDGVKHTRAGVSSPDLFADIPVNAIVEAVIFDGAGLDDATSGGTFTDTANAVFEITIATAATPDTFNWLKNEGGGASGVNVSTSPVALSDGVTIVWAADTGHTVADVWTFYAGSKDTEEGWATT